LKKLKYKVKHRNGTLQTMSYDEVIKLEKPTAIVDVFDTNHDEREFHLIQ
jgi:hypothetical protein